MLQLRPNCECCNRDLPAGTHDAMICSFECTFCRSCAQAMQDECPNCGGELVPRPPRAERLLQKYPASTERIRGKNPCPPP
ncbi:MAG TPA: DUF1272 domain-containing protein [Steroidobacteraceae bacterium]|nr:DUF1272 domain-containing protein [Steroidobacteraceae bacterium]